MPRAIQAAYIPSQCKAKCVRHYTKYCLQPILYADPVAQRSVCFGLQPVSGSKSSVAAWLMNFDALHDSAEGF